MVSKIPCAIAKGSLTATVQLKNAADVFLVDELNYRKYTKGQQFTYYGGHYRKTPVQISVSGTGKFYLIVQGSSYSYSFTS
ncbi:DUF1883 domain-containing protein [Carnobacterium sp. PL12RED10]|nr:DUF1883 domain-containing protein [Carnobacterium sp. PL12RED10]